jgi:hypothetical protein
MYPHQDLTHKIISAAIEVHKNLGPGLLETVYSHCLALELELRGLRFHKELDVPLYYKNGILRRILGSVNTSLDIRKDLENTEKTESLSTQRSANCSGLII